MTEKQDDSGLKNPMLNQRFINDVVTHWRGAVPAMVVNTRDRRQFNVDIEEAAGRLGFKIVHWDADMGLVYKEPKSMNVRRIGVDDKERNKLKNQLNALEKIRNIVTAKDLAENEIQFSTKTVFLFRNFNECWNGMPFGMGNVFAVRELIVNCLPIFKTKTCSFLFYGPNMDVPEILMDDVQRLEYTLPGKDALRAQFDWIRKSAAAGKLLKDEPTEEIIERSILSTQGLTASKAEQAFALSLIKNDYNYNTRDYWQNCSDLRKDYIKELGLVELVETHGGFDDSFAGYDHVRNLISRDMAAMTPEAKEFGVDKPSGFLIGGPAGTGKSALVKATGHEFGLDVLWISANKILDSKYGESEKRLRAILSLPELYLDCGCILWFDECDKLFGSLTSKGDDSTSGTGLRMLSILLTYLQERNYNDADNAYIMATFNDGHMLPDAMIRCGRFNSRTWIGLPELEERMAIYSLHHKRRKRNPEDYDLKKLAKSSERFTGAEIEHVVSESIVQCFCNSGAEHSDVIMAVAEGLTPQADNEDSEYHRQTQWAKKSGFIKQSESLMDMPEFRGLVGPGNMIKVNEADLKKKKPENNK